MTFILCALKFKWIKKTKSNVNELHYSRKRYVVFICLPHQFNNCRSNLIWSNLYENVELIVFQMYQVVRIMGLRESSNQIIPLIIREYHYLTYIVFRNSLQMPSWSSYRETDSMIFEYFSDVTGGKDHWSRESSKLPGRTNASVRIQPRAGLEKKIILS